ncbi:MAG: MATE family efflux transporter [Candidatus Eisenbacteria bacterium]|nr:MATE family efflux transporter [Candidatus Eisenbacteria bacterium]
MNGNNHVLAGDRLGRLLFRLSTPAVIGMLVMGLYNMVDTVFVGRGVGTLGIAGIIVVFPIQVFTMAIGQMLGIGAASIISRAIGAGDLARAETAFANMLLVTALFSAALTVAGYAFLEPLLRAFGASDAILPYARDYMWVLLIGTLPHTFAMAGNNVIRAEGSARTAMMTMLVGAALNIILDPILIFGFGWGIRGAAWATTISKFVSMGWMAAYFLSARTGLKPGARRYRPDWPVLRETFALGSSAFARSVSGSVLAVALNRTLGSVGGDLYVAVWGVVGRLVMFTLTPLIGIAQGLQPIAGFNFGAGRLDKTDRVVRIALAAATVFATGAFLVLLLLPRPILSIFTRDAALIDEGVRALRWIILALPLVGLQIVGSTVFLAVGRALPALFLTLSRQVIFLLPLVLVLPLFWSVRGVWIAFPVADTLATVVTLAFLLPQLRAFRARAAGAA